MNLVRCVADGAAHDVYGGEVCGNARALLAEVATASGRRLTPFAFDFRKSESLRELRVEGRPWVLATVHAIEQLDKGSGSLIETILELPHRPTRVVHLEPAQPPLATNEADLVKACRKYATINRYNTDLLDVLLRHQAKRRLTIRDVRPRMFGMSAFNPTTFIEWEPT